MKLLIILTVLLSFNIQAETFKLAAGTTHRAKGVGYDCGEFFKEIHTKAPKEVEEKKVVFNQFSADKDLNTFLIEGVYPSANNQGTCTYGVFFNRDRQTKTLNFDQSKLEKSTKADCLATKEWLDQKFKTVNYYASKRGIRYVGITFVEGKNDLCGENTARIVFDRRAMEESAPQTN